MNVGIDAKVQVDLEALTPIIESVIRKVLAEQDDRVKKLEEKSKLGLLCMKDFLPTLGISNRHWLTLVSAGKAPPGIQITDSERSTRWRDTDIMTYIKLRQEKKWWCDQ